MASTLELINRTLSLIGERPITTSTGSLGALTRNALTTAIYGVVQSTRASSFEQWLTFTATNDDFLVPAGVLPPTVAQVNKVSYRVTGSNRILVIKEQPLELLPHMLSYSVVGSNLFVSPMFARPVTLFASVLNVPELPADDVNSPIPEFIAGAVAHTAASILCLSYLDDPNAASLQRSIANELTVQTRLQYGQTRGKNFNIGGENV